MLQDIGGVAKPKLVPRNRLRYLQTTLVMGGGGLVSEFMWGIVGAENEQNVNIKRHFSPNELKEGFLVDQDWNTLQY